MTFSNRAIKRRSFIATSAAGLMVAFRARAADDWLGPYPPLSSINEDVDSLVGSRPDLARAVEIGRTVEDRPIQAIRIGRDEGSGRPRALYMANIHAGEVVSGMVAMAVLARLIEDDGVDPWITSLIDRTDIWIIPVLNPDGYHRVVSTAGKGGGLGTRKNANGVDLNRNFPLVPGAKSRHRSPSPRPGPWPSWPRRRNSTSRSWATAWPARSSIPTASQM